jgi:uncharacterized protein
MRASPVLGTLIVIAKQPRPGRVKTRLMPHLDGEQAARVAAAALSDTLRVANTVPARSHLLAFDGDPASWTPPGWRTCAQPDGDLDVRLVAAFEAARPGPAVLVGMDTPQLRPEDLTVFDPRHYDACLGRAPDGGYWAIGFADPGDAHPAISGVPMSMPNSADEQLDRLLSLGMRVQLLAELTDVDTIEAAHEVAAATPASEFARTLRQLLPTAALR